MSDQFDVLYNVRISLLKIVDGLTLDQINTIPTGFNNNIAWNLAHLVVTQQLLCYKLGGEQCLIEDDLINQYRKGSKPNSDLQMSMESWEQWKEWFLAHVDVLKKDYESGKFKAYNTYTTSAGVTLDSIEKAIEFNNFHEGIHTGYIQALKRCI